MPVAWKSRHGNRHTFAVRGVLFLIVAFLLAPATVHASRLISASVGSRDQNTTILVLQFDEAVQLRLQNAEGNSLTLSGDNIAQGPASFRSSGLIRGVRVEGGSVLIDARRYVKARIASAGSGSYLLVLEKATEPPQSQKPASQQVQQSRSTTARNTPQRTDSEAPSSPAITPKIQNTPAQSQDKVVPEPTQPNPSLQEDLGDLAAAPSGGDYVAMLDLYEFVPIQPIVLPSTVQFALEISQQGNRDRAIVLLESVKQDEPEFGWSRIALGRLMEQDGDYSKALDYYREALPQRETEGVASVRIALAFQALGNRDASVGMWERVLDMNTGQIYVDPAEMPRPPAIPRTRQQIQTPPGDLADVEMASSEGGAINEIEVVAGDSVRVRSAMSNLLNILRFWPYVVGLIVLLAGLFYGLQYVRRRAAAGGSEYDIHTDLANLGLDQELADHSEAAGAHVANMYAKQQTAESDDEIELDIPDVPDSAGDEPGEEAELILDDEPASESESEMLEEDLDISEAKREKVKEMFAEGSSVREIAEELGLGQDEVRLVIRLAEADA